MPRFIRDNALSLVLLLLFAVSLLGNALTGHRADNVEREGRGLHQRSLGEYLTSGEFIEVVFENWESEFLQMAMYVALTAVLVQRGSAESKDPDGNDEQRPVTKDSPWPVRRGGVVRQLYSVSLTAALLGLFLVSFVFHAVGGAKAENDVSWLDYLQTSKFWFESFQNWQSEFLSVFAMVVLSIWLRQKGSPESKAVEAPHAETGA